MPKRSVGGQGLDQNWPQVYTGGIIPVTAGYWQPIFGNIFADAGPVLGRIKLRTWASIWRIVLKNLVFDWLQDWEYHVDYVAFQSYNGPYLFTAHMRKKSDVSTWNYNNFLLSESAKLTKKQQLLADFYLESKTPDFLGYRVFLPEVKNTSLKSLLFSLPRLKYDSFFNGRKSAVSFPLNVHGN